MCVCLANNFILFSLPSLSLSHSFSFYLCLSLIRSLASYLLAFGYFSAKFLIFFVIVICLLYIGLDACICVLIFICFLFYFLFSLCRYVSLFFSIQLEFRFPLFCYYSLCLIFSLVIFKFLLFFFSFVFLVLIPSSNAHPI